LKAKEDAKKREEEKKDSREDDIVLSDIRILNLLKNQVNRPKEF